MRAELVVGGVVLGLVGLGLVFLASNYSPQELKNEGESKNFEKYKEITGPSGFVNTDGITINELVGKKVILIDFLTYSCINCQRTFPYVNAWYEKYKDQGLEIIGVHTPEFAFEKDIENVREAMREFGIKHPIVLDNDYATWRAYGNRYWPRKYLIDIEGNIVYDHIGEGAYEETENKIKELLEERSKVLGEEMSGMDENLVVSLIPATKITSQSPETYFGSLRNEYLANGNRGISGIQTFSLPKIFSPSTLYFGGVWKIEGEYAESISNSSLVYRYKASEVYLVAESQLPVEVEVFQDGKPVEVNRGEDVGQNGVVSIKESKLYKIIKNNEPGDHILELRIKREGVRLYAFTFG